MGYNSPGIIVQNYYEIMERKCIFEIFSHSELIFTNRCKISIITNNAGLFVKLFRSLEIAKIFKFKSWQAIT